MYMCVACAMLSGMKQLDPKSVWIFFFKFFPTWIIASVFLVQFIGPIILLPVLFFNKSLVEGSTSLGFIGLIIFVTVVGVVLSYLWAKLSYHYYRYELTDLGFKKEHGIIWKKYVTIPYDRIQNVDIYRGIIARLLNLSDLQIQTAGGIVAGSYGAFSEGSLPGLSKEVAEQLRDELISRSRRQTSQATAQGL